MRKSFAAEFLCTAFLCTAVLLPAGVAAAARQHDTRGGQHQPMSAHAPNADAAFGAVLGERAFVPLAASLTAGSTTVRGWLYNSYGVGQSAKTVEWDSWDAAEQRWYWGQTTTAADGSYVMYAQPTSIGEVWAYPDDGTTFARGARTWTNGAEDRVDLYPGRVAVTAVRGGKWGDFSTIITRFYGSTAYSKGRVTTADTTSSPAGGSMDVLSGSYYGGSVKFFWDEGMEFGAASIAPGASYTLSADEAKAQRVWITSPYWWSGKAGATVRLARGNFPAGWINHVSGYTDNPTASPHVDYGAVSSQGGATESVSVKVPATAKPGYGYWIGFQHVDASGESYPLYLEEMYQVCTLKASKTRVARGARIRVNGIIPTEGHWGDQTGLSKYVTLYAHKGKTGVPTKWKPRSQGWTKVGRVRANGRGVYRSPYFRVFKTLTLVVRYPGDNWYFDAYTSPLVIKVR